jgi:5-formyltetrahydrofolate cyclo-ligase
MRNRRRDLSPAQQRHAAERTARQITRHPMFLRSRHIALYLPNDGEVDPRTLIKRIRKLRKVCYLPVLHPRHPRQLWFVRYERGTPLHSNRFGIPEPNPHRHPRRAPAQLDLVLMPLVAFDRKGSRLGMGGGFYDTTFAFKQRRSREKPYLVGLAHSCQEVSELPVASWDIPLTAIVTDREVIECRKGYS